MNLLLTYDAYNLKKNLNFTTTPLKHNHDFPIIRHI